MLVQYLPMLMLLALAVVMTLVLVYGTQILGPRNRTVIKAYPYESGLLPERQNLIERNRFPVQFYMVAMLFIIFDIEAVFTFPWAVVLRDLGWYGFGVMAVFLLLLIESYYYIVKKGALDWEGFDQTRLAIRKEDVN
ncbi:NADH-quinone oxidoreductase subunit A [Stomatohabitans albus]|uniref:NADH-quinone oxidoreductase subunit A n=1 Tax=Stomatohabitans albus TaxID=3110766 RepID=UPI00300C5067